ncbi:MAG: H-type small acid-soluble spore protein [Bacteroidota bacterium]
MKRERAEEILHSPDNIYVTYQNIPVWIDEVEEEDTARVRDLNSDLVMEVPVAELTEIGPEH